ncbi:pyruvate dehydrogenase (acetyl-transferring) E1 component subunit alpha [Geomesophilobacter sediminis]|uniref:Pyruvate dehydrogenase E1 component subunit alpha n=1 Tax=Geomesophilobacter sediminis TaxID=2798584 RepID=A0A8J7IVK5_9BACT|nr:pyruvate dehydrogenase (acetyl-transferring) E1 component subunit alpha [Geomesophilobacter sediminis]MBJ6723197.1 pyruvate dehydrogenase (acetyl-transferring) E1 component subunit alpha [Geomesophilobacter sediminis]
MPQEILATFNVRRLSILDPDGNVDEALMPELPDAELRRMYEMMVLLRTYDNRALALQREGRLGTYPPSFGQEAAQIGSAFALKPTDWVFPSFREVGIHLTLGYPIAQLYQYWAGDERGQRGPDHLNIFPFCVSVGTHLPHAVGAALAARYRKDPVAVAVFFGDGATSKGDFHEAFNMAGALNAPVVFVCQNNQWAISIPVREQTAAATLAQKAFGYGFEGIQVDGNDVLAVYRGVKEALDRARDGGGPTFVECLTYRMADHTTADDAARYRPPEEVASWRERDPLLRLERFLARRGLWDEAYRNQVQEQVQQTVDAGVRAMEEIPPPERSDLFTYTAAAPTPRQAAQLEES